MVKYKTFQRLIILLALLLVPTTILFAYANQYSQKILQENLEDSATKQLQFTVTSLEQSLEQIETQALLLVNDSSIKSYATAPDFPEYVNHLILRKAIEEKLLLQKEANHLISNLTVFWPGLDEAIATNARNSLTKEQFVKAPRTQWFRLVQDDKLSFHFILTNPTFPAADFSDVTSVVNATISEDYLRSILLGMEISGNGHSFFYFDEAPLVSLHEADSMFPSLLSTDTPFVASDKEPVRKILALEDVEYLVQTIHIPSLNGALISYVKLDEFLSPLERMNMLVNGSLLFLFFMGLAFSYLLYRHFRLPFGYLVKKIESLGAGNYNSRATVNANNEFNFLFERFNEMASRIQTLIENVYEERVRTREAEYKHLQSQINPHFLYNCLFYIVSMAHKSPDAVIKMSKNLAHYYRHITRKAGTDVTLLDEIQLVESYLEVQSLRNKRLVYEIDIPSPMLSFTLPTLILQPVVENAILHGLERKRDSGKITIKGKLNKSRYLLIVDDDGAGVSPHELEELKQRINDTQSPDETSCGLRNIHLRLVNRFGEGVDVTINEWGGLRVSLTISEEDRGMHNESIIGR